MKSGQSKRDKIALDLIEVIGTVFFGHFRNGLGGEKPHVVHSEIEMFCILFKIDVAFEGFLDLIGPQTENKTDKVAQMLDMFLEFKAHQHCLPQLGQLVLIAQKKFHLIAVDIAGKDIDRSTLVADGVA